MSKGRFVVDNSIVMSWCFQDEADPYADSVLESLTESLAVVPAIWPLEVANVLLVAERRKRLSSSGLAHFFELLRALPISVEQETPARMLGEIYELARSLRLSSYDASYLDLSMRSSLPLATRDKALLSAAKKCGVSIYGPTKI